MMSKPYFRNGCSDNVELSHPMLERESGGQARMYMRSMKLLKQDMVYNVTGIDEM